MVHGRILLSLLAASVLTAGPFTYQGNSTANLVTQTYPPADVSAGRGTKVFDTAFVSSPGVPIIRVTDFALINSCFVGSLFTGVSGSESNIVSAQSNYFYTEHQGTATVMFTLNKAAFTEAPMVPPAGSAYNGDRTCGFLYFSASHHGIGAEPSFSFVTDGLLYGPDLLGNINSFNVASPPPSGNASTVVNAQAITGVNFHNRLVEMSIAHNEHGISAIGGGTAQDNDYLVFWYDQTAGVAHYLDADAKVIDGTPFTQANWQTGNCGPGGVKTNTGVCLHNARISGNGRYVRVDFAGSNSPLGGGVYIWDTTTATVYGPMTNGNSAVSVGHQTWSDTLLGFQWPNGIGSILPNWGYWPSPSTSTSAYTLFLPTTSWTFGAFAGDTHPCWNASSSTVPNAPMLLTAGLPSNPPEGTGSSVPFGNEVFGLATDGSAKWWRMFFNQNDECDGSAIKCNGTGFFNFWYLGDRGIVSSDGQYFVFWSDWMGQYLATHGGSPQLGTYVNQTYTDLVIGTPNTTVTSAAHVFGTTTGLLNITGGTGCTVQNNVPVLSTSGGVATTSIALGTIGSTCTGNQSIVRIDTFIAQLPQLGGSHTTLLGASSLIGLYTFAMAPIIAGLLFQWRRTRPFVG